MLTMSLVKIGVDLHIFETLASSQQSCKLEDLAATTGASRGLLGLNLPNRAIVLAHACRTSSARFCGIWLDRRDWQG